MLSFPIPVQSPEIGISPNKLRFRGRTLASIFQELGFRQDEINKEFHYDPEIQPLREVIPYGAFGQNGAALGHLRKRMIIEGDVFLFFGTFSEALPWNNKLKYKPMHPFHAIWGFLIVDEVIDNIHTIPHSKYPELVNHPHYINRDLPQYVNGNAIFVGKRFGSFKFSEELRLTKVGYKKSYWSLPIEFKDLNMTYNDLSSGIIENGRTEFMSASKGQEFVIENTNGRLDDWLRMVLKCSV